MNERVRLNPFCLRGLSPLRAQFPQKGYPLTFCFQNLAVGIKQIAGFFGFSLTGEQIQTILAQSTFQAMRAKSQETHGAVGPFLFRKGKVTLVSGTSISLHLTGNPHTLNKTGLFFSSPSTRSLDTLQKWNWQLHNIFQCTKLLLPLCLSLCADKRTARAPALH